MKKLLLVLFVVLATASLTNAQKLDKFGSSVEKTIGPKTIRVPYTDVISYLGFVAPGTQDAIVEGKKFYYIYVWVPAVVPEIGVRMMSPVGDNKIKGAIESADYSANAASTDYFDTYITIERSNIIKVEDISADKAKSAKWITLDKNDDSSDMPAQPSGSKYNSLIRYTSVASDPLKALTVGLYRIGFTTYKTGEVKGTFLAEIASPVKIPGVAVAKTIDELLVQLKK